GHRPVGLPDRIVVRDRFATQLEPVPGFQRQRVLSSLMVHQMDALAVLQRSHSGAILARTVHKSLLRRPILLWGAHCPRIAMGLGLFSFSLLDGLTRCSRKSNRYPVRLRRPHLRKAPADFGLDRLATTFMNSPSWRLSQGFQQGHCSSVP